MVYSEDREKNLNVLHCNTCGQHGTAKFYSKEKQFLCEWLPVFTLSIRPLSITAYPLQGRRRPGSIPADTGRGGGVHPETGCRPIIGHKITACSHLIRSQVNTCVRQFTPCKMVSGPHFPVQYAIKRASLRHTSTMCFTKFEMFLPTQLTKLILLLFFFYFLRKLRSLLFWLMFAVFGIFDTFTINMLSSFINLV